MYIVGPWSRARAMVPLTQIGVAPASAAIFATLCRSACSYRRDAAGPAQPARQPRRPQGRGAPRAGIMSCFRRRPGCLARITCRASVEEVNSFFESSAARSCFRARILWVLYLALEPYGRRFWPDGLLGWTRLLSGHVRDPRIGREILIGCAFGGALMLVDLLALAVAAPHRQAAGRIRRFGDGGRGAERIRRAVRHVGRSDVLGSVQTALFIAMLLVVRATDRAARRGWRRSLGIVMLIAAAVRRRRSAGRRRLALLRRQSLRRHRSSSWRSSATGCSSTRRVMILAGQHPERGADHPARAVVGGASRAICRSRSSSRLACFGFYAARAGQPLFGDSADGKWLKAHRRVAEPRLKVLRTLNF